MGVSPTICRNRDENDPMLEKPTAMQVSVIVRLAPRIRSCARSIRRRVRYRIGVSPYAAWKHRVKWYFEMPPTAANWSTVRSR